MLAVTVNVDELPEVIEAGLAAIVTVGAGGGTYPGILFAHPVNSKGSDRQDNSAAGERRRKRNRGTRTLLIVFSILFFHCKHAEK